MKKMIALLAAVALLLCSVPAVALAADTTEEEPFVEVICEDLGDIDLDGSIAAADARLALRYSVSLEDFLDLPEGAFVRADTDADEKVTAADARFILRLAVKLEQQPEHNYTVKTVSADALKAAATCSAAAEYYYSCAVCGDVDKNDEKTFTDGDVLGHDWTADNTAATWTKKGETKDVCSRCGEERNVTEVASKIEAMVADANAWAKDAGLDCLISGEADGEEVKLVINVDGIWNYAGATEGAFDGFLTKIGEYVKENIGAAVITLDGEKVYEDGTLFNSAVKTVLFNVGDGFFCKIADLADDGVYGEYAVKVDDEDVALSVVFEGSDENLAKVKSFADTIAEHVYAVKGNDLVIGIDIPDALAGMIKAAGDSRLMNATVEECLDKLANMTLDDVLGSEISAVNKLVALLCDDGVVALANKVLGKFSDVSIGGLDALSGEAYAPETANFKGFVLAVKDMLSEQILGTKIYSFRYIPVGTEYFDKDCQFSDTGYFELPISFKVNVGNADLMQNAVIEETVVIRIHYQLDIG